MDSQRERYPFCIVWTVIPMISWILPFVGHVGVCDSEGRIYDFAGPYLVNCDEMGFGAPTKYLKLDPNKIGNGKDWDKTLNSKKQEYSKKWYDFFFRNCHHFVCSFLNEIKYDNSSHHNIVEIAFKMFFQSSSVSTFRLIKSFCGFVLIFSFFAIFFLLSLSLAKKMH